MDTNKEAVLAARRQRAEFIIAHPGRFGMCEGCESIIDFHWGVIFCPGCGGYHFSWSQDKIQELAARLANQMPVERAADFET